MTILVETVAARIGVPEVAKWIGVCPATVRKWVREGKLPRPFSVNGSRPRFDVQEIRDWIRVNSGEPATPV